MKRDWTVPRELWQGIGGVSSGKAVADKSGKRLKRNVEQESIETRWAKMEECELELIYVYLGYIKF